MPILAGLPHPNVFFGPLNESIRDLCEMFVLACRHTMGIDDPAAAVNALFPTPPVSTGFYSMIAPSQFVEITGLMRYMSYVWGLAPGPL